jgi:S-adenosylmethionine:tRNA ribosyltransferase-isomerase
VPLEDYDYDLPREFIAQEGVEPRESARMLVLREDDGIEHRTVRELPSIMERGDVLVLNESQVLPARVMGRKLTGGKVELLLLGPWDGREVECQVGGRGLEEGSVVQLGDGTTSVETELMAPLGEGRFMLRLPDGWTGVEVARRWGEMPTPPYIRQRLEDPERYMTTFGRVEGSVAAPTAGLHFSDTIISALETGGVELVRLVLHVGIGTFKPIRVPREEEHQMEAEWVEIGPGTAERLTRAVSEGRRVFVVGTTSVRALESATDPHGRVQPFKGPTDLFIYPPYRFRFPYAGLLTNFHLPRSTLLMLVSAFAGRERVLRAYGEAMAEGYRFYSLGDAMLFMGGPSG